MFLCVFFVCVYVCECACVRACMRACTFLKPRGKSDIVTKHGSHTKSGCRGQNTAAAAMCSLLGCCDARPRSDTVP